LKKGSNLKDYVTSTVKHAKAMFSSSNGKNPNATSTNNREEM
jgi:hypothetical protein